MTSCMRMSHKQSQVWLVAKLGQKLQIVSDGTRYPEIHQVGTGTQQVGVIDYFKENYFTPVG